MGPIFPPHRAIPIVVLLVGTGVLAFLSGWQLTGWAYYDVAAASAEVRQAVLYAGILVAGVAAWVASSVSSPSLAYIPYGSKRRGKSVAGSHIVVLTMAAWLGYTIGFAPGIAITVVRSVYGSLDVWSIISAYACLAGYASLGYLCGCLTRSYVAVPAAVAVAYAVLFVSPAIVSPMLPFDIVSGLEVPARVSALRTAVYAGVAVATGLSASVWLRLHCADRWTGAMVAVGGLLSPVLLVGFLASRQAMPLVVLDGAQEVCHAIGSSAVCLHPARAELLEPLGSQLGLLQQEFGPTLIPPLTLRDATLESDSVDSPEVLQIQNSKEDSWLRVAVADMAGYAAGIGACERAPDATPEGYDSSVAVAAFFMRRTDFPAGTVSMSPVAEVLFQQMITQDEETVLAILESNASALHSCMFNANVLASK